MGRNNGDGAMKGTILIVDDDADSRVMLQRAVEAEGLAVMLAGDGGDALKQLEGTLPDLVLMDAIMPGLDGFDTCRRIKATPRMAHLPVIFMTGLTQTEHVLRGLQAGGVDYVTKPLVLDELIARVQVHLGNARTAQRAVTALNGTGGRIVAADDAGQIVWATRPTLDLLDEMGPESRLAVERAFRGLIAQPSGSATIDIDRGKLVVATLAPGDGGEHLFSLSRTIEGGEIDAFQSAFGLTRREAEVLLWIARGKSNRDASEILNISARTVNKHLEQIFIKMGVENRAAAAAAATRIMIARSG
jgi:DNA-binding response OmpR family regulator/DNA-binding CsgD family transcriptional regulator